MSCCGHCADAEDLFSRRAARRDLRRYRRRGPIPATRRLLRMLRREEVRGRVLLDVGGGIGAIQHELLREGLARAVHVDASTAYLQASGEEAARQGHRDRVEYHHGDFVDLAAELPEADVVTLDRVVCCYPDMPRLVEASASKARHLYGLSYPRRRWATRAAFAAGNLFFRLRGSAFRTYLHPPEAIAAELRRQGLQCIAQDRTFLWHVALYRRVQA
ncbi:MAG TPA: class I SAM-dependent methyltransferase [Longimicrobiaceae bacterium]|nr:class I SAM-dependent methyltransferase [Longimicrobiaceae bacterium]